MPHPFASAADLVRRAGETGLAIAALQRANELARRPAAEIDAGLARLWSVMSDSIDRGLAREGELPGGLKVRRRARAIHERLLAERGQNLTAPHTINDWIAIYAIAVNEENAAGAQVVTAPTNGAAGVVPATLRYFLDHVPGASAAKVPEFLLTAAAIGSLIKRNASISGAEVGCQGEVGSAAAMAAAGLAAVLGGTPAQIENAAEIALEHHLGMTCDPIAGPRPGALHRAQRARRDQGGLGRLAGAARRRPPPRQPRRLHRDDAADRPRHGREVQGDEPRRPRGERAGLLKPARQ